MEKSQKGVDKVFSLWYNTDMKNNNNNNERENKMPFQFDDFDTQIQSDELVSDAELYAAEEFMLDLDDELNIELSMVENEFDHQSLDEMLDSESCYDEQRDFDFYTS